MKNSGSAAFAPKSTTGWTANVYTTGGNWEAMEEAGAVFLPAAGYRTDGNLYNVGTHVHCWSSSDNGIYFAYRGVTATATQYTPGAQYNRGMGLIVRLITDMK